MFLALLFWFKTGGSSCTEHLLGVDVDGDGIPDFIEDCYGLSIRRANIDSALLSVVLS